MRSTSWGQNFKGDPASALLEVLDPEQNREFTDHYVDMPFDLSRVLFITTANDVSRIPGPLYDRMDIIELGSYTQEEKLNIAMKHLVRKQLEKHGLTSKQLRFTKAAVRELIEGYTREAGVRTLERMIASVCRKAAKMVVSDPDFAGFTVRPEDLEELLGPRKFTRDQLSGEGHHRPGQRPGLDQRGRGAAAHRGGRDGGHREDPAHRLPGGRDEGVGQRRHHLYPHQGRGPGHLPEILREVRHPHPRPGGRRAQGRPLRRHGHGHGHHLRSVRHPPCATTWP